ncbi:uncharacterized protein CCOS01_10127 [Colletotrichum costaricense]|uniref:Uncharacterized protein n=1 Tax=Colletotrichum costaricense TaxID=1209916 RepID=A0AAJ0DZ88_9PEZI|nr:uncharacterized protein CCOS01_10127 [Colletotrichum costaricense]KAK1522415.1 hypothetical protein CCOS01_10127 [Colletotrichum costaricense]
MIPKSGTGTITAETPSKTSSMVFVGKVWAILENTEMSRSRGVGVHLAFLAPPVGADEPAQGKKAEIAAPEVGRLLGLREPFEGRTRVRLQPERRTT